METFSALLAFCAGNSPVTGEFPAQRTMTRSFDVFFDLRLDKRLSKQWWGWWFETTSHPSWRHNNDDGETSTKVYHKSYCRSITIDYSPGIYNSSNSHLGRSSIVLKHIQIIEFISRNVWWWIPWPTSLRKGTKFGKQFSIAIRMAWLPSLVVLR